jgi:lysophospholipase L1-like esterase
MKVYLLVLAFALTLASASAQVQIMCLGDSITKGAVDPAPSMSGYRARLFELLNQSQVKYLFVGCTDNNSSPAMIKAGQQFHNGYGSWRIDSLRANLDGEQQPWGDPNMGGYWLTGGTGALRQPVFPDIVLLLAGTNDLGQNASESVLESRMTDLLTWFQTNRPKSQVFVGTVPPRGPDKDGHEQYNIAVTAFNTWLTQEVPSLGDHFHLVDLYALFVDGSGQVKGSDSSDGIFLKDGIHPSHNGYVAMGDAWFKEIGPLLNLAPTSASTLPTNSGSASTAVNKATTVGGLQKIVSPQDAVQGVKLTVKGGPTILTVDGDYGGSGSDEPPGNALDGDPTTKYFCHAQNGTKDPGVDTGLLITPKIGSSVVTGIQFYTGNDMPDRDPVSITLEGSNDSGASNEGCKNFTLIYEGKSGLDSDPDRGNAGLQINFPNDVAYKTYRLLITKTRATTDATQYGEVILLGKPAP